MMIRKAKPATSTRQAKKDPSTAFEKPAEYVKGEFKRLKEFHGGEWWLNVDYVDYIDSRSAC